MAPSIYQTLVNTRQLRQLSLVDTMLCDQAFDIVMQGTTKSLISLDLSRNEQLTSESYKMLQGLTNLKFLYLERNDIDDEKLAVLLEV
jgi:hypothetical protein